MKLEHITEFGQAQIGELIVGQARGIHAIDP